MKCRLTNLSENKHLRTSTVDGECQFLPEVSTRFTMTAESLTKENDFRVVSTTPVQRIGDELVGCTEQLIEFWTMNTHYKLEVFRE